jgi:hypothetical protein
MAQWERDVRDNSRRRKARARSHRASARELHEAKLRIKEIEEELHEIPLLDETKRGEDRDARYARVLKLRALRQDFEAQHPYDKRPHANGLVLSLVLVVASFIFCAAVSLTAYGSYRFLTDKPDPVVTASAFWDGMEAQTYADVHSNYFSPTLRVQEPAGTFAQDAGKTDADYGPIKNVVLTDKQVGPNSATFVYKVTRTLASGKSTTYDATITMDLFQGSWGVSDLGAAITPSLAGAPAPGASPVPSPTKTK